MIFFPAPCLLRGVTRIKSSPTAKASKISVEKEAMSVICWTRDVIRLKWAGNSRLSWRARQAMQHPWNSNHRHNTTWDSSLSLYQYRLAFAPSRWGASIQRRVDIGRRYRTRSFAHDSEGTTMRHKRQ